MRRLYFDHNATCPLRDGACQALLRCWEGPPAGNPSSVHAEGRLARRWLEEARERLAACLDCQRDPAPHLRPEADIFSTQWRPPADAGKAGRALMAAYHIDTKHRTDCTVCHR